MEGGASRHWKVWTYEYDPEGRLLGWLDGAGTHVKVDLDPVEKRPIRTWVETAGPDLSTMAWEEKFQYDDFNRIQEAQTMWVVPDTGEERNLVKVDRNIDGFGRMLSAAFGFDDDGNHNPLAVETLTSGWTWSDQNGSHEDLTFRRSLTGGTGFELDFTPDGAGKVSKIGLKGQGTGLPGWNLSDWTTYRYEGSRPLSRSVLPGSGTNPPVTTTWEFDTLGYVKRILAKYESQNPVTVLDMGIDRDVEGNVLALHYGKVSGKSGDRFQLDGFDRLKDAFLGVNDFTSNYPPAVRDKRITYALDAAHNREYVAEDGGAINYERNPGTNEYKSVGGVDYTYDGNGNLACDGWFVYRYDLHDRLSKVYVITYPAGASGGSLAEKATGVFEGVVIVDGVDVTVRGTVVDGVFRIGSAWR